MRLFRNWCLVWVVSVAVTLVIVGSLPPVRREFHKWRLQSLKKHKQDYYVRGLSRIDKLWMQVTGTAVDISSLNGKIESHEQALMRLGFLYRETFVTGHATVDEVRGTVQAVNHECPWQHVEMLWDTNVVVTACAHGIQQWRKRANELGWKANDKT
ncbi:MAG TPA: hypothetical protein VJ063_17130 [Verrucomicrobiae bacterium]|nr:hypothetical protein [Verrucomicrobiae bacterium]